MTNFPDIHHPEQEEQHMSITENRSRRRTAKAVVAGCLVALACAPAASAQTGVGPVDTIVGSLSGGVQKPHDYVCDENNPAVRYVIDGVRDSLKTRFPDMATMAARGYAPYIDAPIAMQQGQGHWLNPNFLRDGHMMDPRYPEGILVDKWNRPIGVMFIADDPYIPGPDMYVAEDGTPCNAWHYHTETAADAYWYLYKYLWTKDIQNGDIEPPDRTPDLMHVWAYGDYKYQWNHGTPPKSQLPGDPKPEEIPAIIGGPKPPTGLLPPVTKRLGD